MSDPDKMIRILITALFSAGRNAVSGCGEKWPEMCKMAFYDSCLVFARGMPPLPPSPPPLYSEKWRQKHAVSMSGGFSFPLNSSGTKKRYIHLRILNSVVDPDPN